jgi:hypothetical protein
MVKEKKKEDKYKNVAFNELKDKVKKKEISGLDLAETLKHRVDDEQITIAQAVLICEDLSRPALAISLAQMTVTGHQRISNNAGIPITKRG